MSFLLLSNTYALNLMGGRGYQIMRLNGHSISLAFKLWTCGMDLFGQQTFQNIQDIYLFIYWLHLDAIFLKTKTKNNSTRNNNQKTLTFEVSYF